MTGGILLVMGLGLATAFDLWKRIIPDTVHVLLLFSGMASIFLEGGEWLSRVAGFLLVGACLLGVGIWSGNLGGGDVKFGASLAFALGLWEGGTALLFGLMLAALCCAVRNQQFHKREAIPLAPCITAGCAAVYILAHCNLQVSI